MESFDKGLALRKKVLGEAHVERSLKSAGERRFHARSAASRHRLRLGRDLGPARPHPARALAPQPRDADRAQPAARAAHPYSRRHQQRRHRNRDARGLPAHHRLLRLPGPRSTVSASPARCSRKTRRKKGGGLARGPGVGGQVGGQEGRWARLSRVPTPDSRFPAPCLQADIDLEAEERGDGKRDQGRSPTRCGAPSGRRWRRDRRSRRAPPSCSTDAARAARRAAGAPGSSAGPSRSASALRRSASPRAMKRRVPEPGGGTSRVGIARSRTAISRSA